MANQISARIYGTLEGSPPFGEVTLPPSRINNWPASTIMGFPAQNIIIHPVTSGFKVGNTYVYGVIEVPASGLNAHSDKYATDTAGATLVTNSNA
jgi:hypothetical protein